MTRSLPGTHTEPYLGSAASMPVYGHLAEMSDTQRRLNPDAYRLINLGVGPDGVAMPARETLRLTAHSDAAADWV
ncbi:MAG TPA: hypothetical protein VE441_08775, partial [Mycobacterium sp.]|nr:hypothetical protein [Mycobacterium sp.]